MRFEYSETEWETITSAYTVIREFGVTRETRVEEKIPYSKKRQLIFNQLLKRFPIKCKSGIIMSTNQCTLEIPKRARAKI